MVTASSAPDDVLPSGHLTAAGEGSICSRMGMRAAAAGSRGCPGPRSGPAPRRRRSGPAGRWPPRRGSRGASTPDQSAPDGGELERRSDHADDRQRPPVLAQQLARGCRARRSRRFPASTANATARGRATHGPHRGAGTLAECLDAPRCRRRARRRGRAPRRRLPQPVRPQVQADVGVDVDELQPAAHRGADAVAEHAPERPRPACPTASAAASGAGRR